MRASMGGVLRALFIVFFLLSNAWGVEDDIAEIEDPLDVIEDQNLKESDNSTDQGFVEIDENGNLIETKKPGEASPTLNDASIDEEILNKQTDLKILDKSSSSNSKANIDQSANMETSIKNADEKKTNETKLEVKASNTSEPLKDSSLKKPLLSSDLKSSIESKRKITSKKKLQGSSRNKKNISQKIKVKKEKISISKTNTHLATRLKKATPIPESLPIYSNAYFQEEIKTEIHLEQHSIPSARERLPAFISESKLNSSGEILEFGTEYLSAGEFHALYLKMEDLPLSENRYYLVNLDKRALQPFGFQDKFSRGISKSGKKSTPYVYTLSALVELTESLPKDKKIYSAKIIKSFGELSKDSLLIPASKDSWLWMDREFSREESLNKPLKILGGLGEGQVYFGDKNFIFLHGGTSEGVKVGSTYAAYGNLRDRSIVAGTNLWRPLGKVKIVHSTENFSLALVQVATEELHVGDWVGNVPMELSAE